MQSPASPFLRLAAAVCAVLLLSAATSLAPAQSTVTAQSKIDPWVVQATAEGRSAEFLVVLADQADLTPAAALPTKNAKGRWVFDTLVATAEATQGPILDRLEALGVAHRSFYIANAIWVRAGWEVAAELAARPDVARIQGNPRTRGLVHVAGERGDAAGRAVELSLTVINAPQVWALGYTGQGVVVGGQDTGYQWDHPALISQYRGWDGTTANHDYNWHDSIHSGGGVCGTDSPVPCDDQSHGTHTMGTVLGDDGMGNQIGVAPGAVWIGSRNMDQGWGSPATYMESFEFFLAPYPVGGNPTQGDPSLAPDVTTNSWLCPGSEGCSYGTLLLASQAQRAAGILTVVAAGNDGSSGCSSIQWPCGLYDEVFSVGAVSVYSGNLASFSSRGPVTVDGSGRLKPDVVAPGTGIRSCVPGNGYASGWSGTSMATPHVAGAVALLWSAHPSLRNDLDATEQVLRDTAVATADYVCGGDPSGVPNNRYGSGRIDVLAAVQAVRSVSLSVTGAPAGVGAGIPAIHTLSVTNTGYAADTFDLTAGPASFPTTITPSVVGPLAAGAAATVYVIVQVPPTAGPGSADQVTVTATSQGWAAATDSTLLGTTVTAAAPSLALTQPGGAGGPVSIDPSGLIAGHEYFIIFSFELCPGVPGSGPYLGLCATDPAALVAQLGVPLGIPPFHFLATQTTASFGPYPAPPGLGIEALCLHFQSGAITGASAVARLIVQ